MLLMRFKPFAFPVEWRFKDPDTGAEFKSKDKPSLVKHIVTYRAHNRLHQIESLDLVLENYLCGLPINSGGCIRMDLQRGFLAYVKGGIALIKNMALGKFVSQEEADRRSQICASCPNNVKFDKSVTQEAADTAAIVSVGNLRSKHHSKLENCAVCTCPLRAKVWTIPPFKLKSEHAMQMREDKPNCWQLPENEFKDRIDKD